MNVLITGGAGFIGSHLTKKYIDRGDDVYVIDNLLTGNKRNIEPLSKEKLHFFEEDIRTFDYQKIPEIEIVYHLASPASPIQYKKYPIETLMTNAYGTFRLMEHAKSGAVKKIVLASTSEVYGDPLVHPQNESYFGNVNPIGLRACYDEAKRFAEALVMSYKQKYNLDVRIARIFNTYGPNMEVDDGRVISNFISQILKGQSITIYGTGKQTRSFCYVSDMVEGIIALGQTANLSGQVINLGNPDEKTVLELVEIIKNLMESKGELDFKPIETDDPKKRRPDITKAQTLLNWEPQVPLEEGLKNTITYFKEIIHSKV